MMISPESYYEMNLKGKTAEQIMSAIRGLKKEIGHLKNVMEHPDYSSESIICPDESTQLCCTREYLERAKEAFTEAGGLYKPSKAEIKAQEFDKNIPFINKIVFSIGGFFGGYKTSTIMFDDKMKVYTIQSFTFDEKLDEPVLFSMEKDEFLDELSWLHIGEWRKSYTPERFGYVVLDGTQWELEIHFANNTKPFKCCGSNSFPYNFDEFQELLGFKTDNIDER